MKLKTYCLAFREHTGNIGSRKVTMTNKKIRDKSRCAEYLSNKLRFLKQNLIKKYYYKTNMLTHRLVCKKDTKNKDEKMIK